ncbi:MAG: DUF4097 domain-containing protein [Spirosomaceae bacterium]|nr:DUF4097 domain-containing protein [Spirosomataceae bacterium]
MKTAIQLLVFLLISTFIFANDDEKPYMTKTFNASAVKSLNVRTSGGSISVTGKNGEAKVEVYVRSNNWNGRDELSTKEIEERLEEYELTVAQEGETLVCKAKRKKEDWSDWKRSLNISFKITVPEKITTDLGTSGGSIRLANLSGTQNFGTSGGSLHLHDLSGDIKGRTSGGSINLSNCKDKLDLTTSGGSIKAENSKGDIRLSTSGGSINLEEMDGIIKVTTSGGSVRGGGIKGELNASTSGGSIRLNNVAASLRASTSAGSVDVEMTALGKYLDLSTSAGGIRVQMPLDKGMDLDLRANRVNVSRLNNFDGAFDKDRVKGKLNGGGTLVTMRANSGSISIND